jgi:hypothetical protein
VSDFAATMMRAHASTAAACRAGSNSTPTHLHTRKKHENIIQHRGIIKKSHTHTHTLTYTHTHLHTHTSSEGQRPKNGTADTYVHATYTHTTHKPTRHRPKRIQAHTYTYTHAPRKREGQRTDKNRATHTTTQIHKQFPRIVMMIIRRTMCVSVRVCVCMCV